MLNACQSVQKNCILLSWNILNWMKMILKAGSVFNRFLPAVSHSRKTRHSHKENGSIPHFFLRYGAQPVNRCPPPDVWRRGIRRLFPALPRHSCSWRTTAAHSRNAGGQTRSLSVFRGQFSGLPPLRFQGGWTVRNTGRYPAQKAHGAGQA